MSGEVAITQDRRKRTSNPVVDVSITIMCILGFIGCLVLFYLDINQSFRSLNIEPAGFVKIKNNTVHRRLSDRLIWDRLFDDSPVYNGDIIRIARLSDATLAFNENEIELGENTLIRVQTDAGRLQLELFSGEVNVISTFESEPIQITIGDRLIEAASGSSLSAISHDGELMLRVTQGEVRVFQDGEVIHATAGTIIVQDARGNDIPDPMAAIIRPRPNARLLKTDHGALNVEFEWARINLAATERLSLEIAEDRDFINIVRTINDLNSAAEAAVDPGLWHWRLSHRNNVLTSGRMTVTDASAPALIMPVQNQVISARNTRQATQFNWSQVHDVLYYLLQISQSQDFTDAEIHAQVQTNSFVVSDLDFGTWYWRVLPVFASVYEGTTRFSDVSSFEITQAPMSAPELRTPVNNSALIVSESRPDYQFSWSSFSDAAFYTFIVSPNVDLSEPVIQTNLRNNFYTYANNETIFTPGQYFWSVSYTDIDGNISPAAQGRGFFAIEREIIHRLVLPADRLSLEEAQLSALNFSWETNLEYDRRLQISSSPDFADMTIDSPVTDSNLRGILVPPGEWYWRISARQSETSQIISTPARRFNVVMPPGVLAEPTTEPTTEQVAAQEEDGSPEVRPQEVATQEPEPEPPPPPFAAPANMSPVTGHRIGAEDLRQKTSIDFTWSPVQGANMYIFTIFRSTPTGRVRIFQTEITGVLHYNMEIIRLQESGTYIWQVEAVLSEGTTIVRHGNRGENSFVLNIPRPGQVRARDMGVLYGLE